MSKLRLASYTLGFFIFAAICAVWAIGGLKSAAAGAPRLLFVSDKNTNEVTYFSLPDLLVKGTITGLNEPRGLCSFPSGHIWVTNYGTQQLFEYSRTGLLVSTLTDPDGYPFTCDVAPDGTRAFGNIRNYSGPGETIIVHGVPLPSYDYAKLHSVHGVGFGRFQDLYIVGRTKAGAFVLAVLPAGSTTIQQIKVTGGTIHFPGMVQWDADHHYLAVGDRRCDSPRTTCVYHIKISALTGTITGKTTFKAYNGHVICDMAQGTIGASGENYLAGGDDESDCGYAKSGVYRWAFPAGGAPTNYNNSTLTHPFGTAISNNSK